jgi:hypothetical protein
LGSYLTIVVGAGFIIGDVVTATKGITGGRRVGVF